VIAALPMYDLPWLRPAHDRLWSLLARGLRKRGIEDVPAPLHRGGVLADTWTSPSLLLGQTCGYPLVTRLKETVQLVATPHYAAEGCKGAYHHAAIVVRADSRFASTGDLRGARAGMNDARSNTGMNLFRASIAPIANGRQFFRSVTITGSHARSLAAIMSDRIDVAAVDAVTLALLRDRYPDYADRLRIIDWTVQSPSLPFITSIGSPQRLLDTLRELLSAIVADPANQAVLQRLRITGFSTLAFDEYQPLLGLEREAAARSYPTLN
jgi:ABC-type phosphate/phosphonate transport system substrate-binding protein